MRLSCPLAATRNCRAHGSQTQRSLGNPAKCLRLTEQLLAEGVPQVGSAAGGDRAKKSHTQAFREMIELRKRAGQAAARAAPFVHPRMGYAVSEVDNDEDFVPLAERIAYYERRDDLNGVSEKAIEQNYQDDQSIRTSGSELPPSVDEDEL